MITWQDFYSMEVFPDQQFFRNHVFSTTKTNKAQSLSPSPKEFIHYFPARKGGRKVTTCKLLWKKKPKALNIAVSMSQHTLKLSTDHFYYDKNSNSEQ